ncbi:hypothetical protein HBI44_101700 [Parastagonospora nodorum]|nr:hypothetical protein HBI51_078460 [Parastagonospora nodorum]KAH5696766.1 hypothetical protein HBI44_101700 [Parastagonospora nodorum]
MPRLGHKKSRLGCRQCKARHVKCDELKPCSNCARHGVQCSLVTWENTAPHPHSASSASGISNQSWATKEEYENTSKPETTLTPPQSSHHDFSLKPPKAVRDESAPALSEGSSPSSQSDQFPFLTQFIHRAEQSQADLWTRDLELMHHWTTEAFEALSQRDDMRQLWRVDAPEHAFQHTFFVHELLAFAALHKAYKLPEQRAQYYAYGIHHQDMSIRGVREKLLNVTSHEAAALVATSTLLTLSVFASTGFELNHPEIPSSQGPIEGILNIFSLMQGMGNVLAMARAQVVNSWLAPMLQEPREAIASQPMLQELVHHIPQLISFVKNKHDLPNVERELYLGVIGNLEPVLQMAMSPRMDNREMRFLFFWPLSLQGDFLGYFRQRHAGALAVVMYYSTILFASQTRYWFMEGWGEQLMRACYEEMDPEWFPAVQWPAGFLSRVPSWNIFSSFVQARNGGQITPLPTHNPSPGPYGQRTQLEVPIRQYATGPSSHEMHASSQYRTVPEAQLGQRDSVATHGRHGPDEGTQ